MESLSGYFQSAISGYRMPDFSKLWRSNESEVDGVDARRPPREPILVQLEAYLVRIQELALWIDPKSSAIALILVHMFYLYLSYTPNTILNLTCWAVLSGYLYTTWVNKIWPEIRVEAPVEEATWTPVRPEVFSGPELIQFTQSAKSKFSSCLLRIKNYRTNSPGLFCLASCTFFVFLGYLGLYVTTIGLFYYITVGYLTIPGLIRYLANNNESIKEHLEAFWAATVPARPAVDAVDSPVAETAYTKVVNKVYSSVQSQITNLVSHLNAGVKADSEDDLQEYLPEFEDEQAKMVLEEGALSSPNFNNQEEEMSLEFSSLVTGLGATMPDIEEDDIDGRRLYPALPSLGSDPDDNEFLPADDQKMNAVDLDDEEDDSLLMYFSGAPRSNPGPSQLVMPSIEIDDFEIISDDELAEVMKK